MKCASMECAIVKCVCICEYCKCRRDRGSVRERALPRHGGGMGSGRRGVGVGEAGTQARSSHQSHEAASVSEAAKAAEDAATSAALATSVPRVGAECTCEDRGHGENGW